jgi:SprT protein
MTQEQVREQVTKTVTDAITRAAAIWPGVGGMPAPRLRFDIRGLSRNGSCCYSSWTLRFNPTIMMVDPDAFCAATVIHEVAHMVAYWLWGRVQPHGGEWKYVMRQLGAVPERCSKYNLSGIVKPGYHEYVCGCCTHHVTTRKHNKIQSGAVYVCVSCRRPLVLASTARAAEKREVA